MTHYGSRDSCMDMRGDGVYQGTRLAIGGIGGGQGLWPVVFLVDLPFSFVADTLILPYDIVDSATQREENRP
jgi:uncharacterized protein YceK